MAGIEGHAGFEKLHAALSRIEKRYRTAQIDFKRYGKADIYWRTKSLRYFWAGKGIVMNGKNMDSMIRNLYAKIVLGGISGDAAIREREAEVDKELKSTEIELGQQEYEKHGRKISWNNRF